MSQPEDLSITLTTAAEKSATGVSLGRDAWSRLRRNRMAMLCLGTLITIVVLAVFTPLLPLAPPDKHHTNLQYEPPKFSSLFEKTFDFDWKSVAESQSRIAELEQKVNSATDKKEANKIESEIANILLRPYRDAGYPTVGAI